MLRTPGTEDQTYEKALEILDRIWHEYDTQGYGIMAFDMEKVLHHVERDLGTSLLDEPAWDTFREYVARVEGTIVSQKDLAGLLGLVHGQQRQLQQQQYLESLQNNNDGSVNNSHNDQRDSWLQQVQQEHNQNGSNQYANDDDFEHTESDPAASASAGARATTAAMTEAVLTPISPFAYRPRSSAPIRRIALQTDSPYPRLRSSISCNGGLAPDADFPSGHYLTSPAFDARSTSSGRSPSPVALNRNAEEYEGFGLDAEPDHIDQDDFLRMKISNADLDRKLKRAQHDYAMRLDEQTKETKTHQEEIERLNQALKTTRKEITELKYTEKSQSAQIQELEQQIHLNEKTTQTQKNGAAALKMQRDELETENRNMQEALRMKEKEMNDLVARIMNLETESRRIQVDQGHMEELQDKLAAEISKNQAMARELEAMQEERRQLRDTVEQLGAGGGINLNLSAVFAAGYDVSSNADNSQQQDVKSLSLWSELSGHRKEFDKPLESEPATPNASVAPEILPPVTPEYGTKLLQESSENKAQFETFKKKYEMKRSSIRDIGQLYQEHANKIRAEPTATADALQTTQVSQSDTQPATPSTHHVEPAAATEVAQAAEEEHANSGHRHVEDLQTSEESLHHSQKKTVSFGNTDDVDCALPDQLLVHQDQLIRPLNKVGKLGEGLGVNQSMLDNLVKHFGDEPLAVAPRPLLQRESMRRRKPQASRAVTQAELDELRSDITVGATTVQAVGEMVSPNGGASSTSTKVARRDPINTKMIANVTLVSMYTIVVYLFGVITSVFLTDGGLNLATRQFDMERLSHVAYEEMAGGGGRRVGFKVLEVLVYWIQNLVFQGDGAPLGT